MCKEKGAAMFDRINTDIKNAMKSKEKEKLMALRYLKSMLIENKTASKPKAELDVVISYHKKLKDSVSSYPEGSEAITKIQTELTFLQPYLPAQLTQAEVQSMIDKIKAENDGCNMGVIMKVLQPEIKGRFDGKQASEMVKESLA